MLIRKFALFASTAVAIMFSAQLADAAVYEDVTMQFNSGAIFNGVVTFVDNLSSFYAVNGKLSGGGYGLGGGVFTWVLNNRNMSNGLDKFVYINYFLDGSSTNGYFNFIQFSYDFSNPSKLIFSSGYANYGPMNANSVNYMDGMLSGTITPVSVPGPMAGAGLPALFALLGFGLYRRWASNITYESTRR